MTMCSITLHHICCIRVRSVVCVLAGALAIVQGCSVPPPPSDPHIAQSNACARIDALLAASHAESRPAPPPLRALSAGDAPVRFWYYKHPIVDPALEGEVPQCDGTAVQSQYLGEWQSAIQKLMVAFAADDLPDVGMVKRGLVARLYESRRIRSLDGILPKSFIDDLRPEVIADYTYDGHLIALPADGFCSLLYFNRHSVGANPPKTWAFFTAFVNAQHATPGPQFPRGLGAFPFMEALWSADGNVLVDGRCGLARPESQRALAFVLDVTGNDLRAEDPAFREWVTGQIAMTVASSRHIPQARDSGMDFGIAPVPGETGPISRRSNDAVVVFSRDVGAGKAAVAAFLDWITGPLVMGERGAANGSVPLRKSVQAFESLRPEVVAAYEAAQNTSLHPDWGAIESELDRALADAYAAAKLKMIEKK